MATNKVQTGLRLEEVALQKITHIARRKKRSLNSMIEHLVQICIEDYEKEYGAIPLVEEE